MPSKAKDAIAMPDSSAPVKYRGVTHHPRKNGPYYSATIVHGGAHSPLGTFPCAEDAARAYDLAAVRYKGAAAAGKLLNFPALLDTYTSELAQASASKGSEEDAEVAPASPQPVKSSKPASNLNSSAKVTKPVSETHLVASLETTPPRKHSNKPSPVPTSPAPSLPASDVCDLTNDTDPEDSQDSEDEEEVLRALVAAVRSELAVEAGSSGSNPSGSGSGSSGVTELGARRAEEAEDGPKGVQWRPQIGLPAPIQGDESMDVVVRAHGHVPLARVTAGRDSRDPRGKAALGLEVGLEGRLLAPPRDKRRDNREARRNAPEVAKGWFDLPAPEITPELKRDLQLLKLRGTWDPKRFYKSNDTGKLPKFFQIGTVIEAANEYYSSRMTKKERKQTITEEVMASEDVTRYRKRRYQEIHDKAQYWSGKRKKPAAGDRITKKKNRGARGNH